ncbi:MAG TPA: signal peptidase I [bacterium]|nr:signal peptidase I [bacterium]HPL95245.1 signal peptidase I [bacterium]
MSDKSTIPSFEPASPKEKAKENFKIFLWETIKIVIVALIIILPLRYYVVQPFYVKGASMEPNFYDHEYLIINEISYRFNEPARGDIVVFKYPQNIKEYYIKRIIGLPGERIVIKDGQVNIFNQQHPAGKTLSETYLESGVETWGDIDVTLGVDEYYVLGDNRTSSKDSRIFGPVARQFIVGKTWVRGWPFNRLAVFKNPIY